MAYSPLVRITRLGLGAYAFLFRFAALMKARIWLMVAYDPFYVMHPYKRDRFLEMHGIMNERLLSIC